MNITQPIVEKIINTVDQGLCSGVGQPIPGHMCVEAAVCYAYGLPHGDNPPCVGHAVREFKIALNDKPWSSRPARAKGLRRLAVAQLGSDKIDQVEFSKLLSEQAIRRIVPLAIRAAAKLCPPQAAALESAAARCEAEGSKESAQAAREAASDAAAYAASDAAAYAAYAASDAAAYAASDAAANAAAYAAYAAYAASYAASDAYAAYAAYAASDAYAAAYARRDQVLSLMADIAVEVLVKLGAEGTQWLWLCDQPGDVKPLDNQPPVS